MTSVNVNYIGSITGRILLLSNLDICDDWSGYDDGIPNCDYDLIEGYVNYEQGEFSIHSKKENNEFIIIFSWSSQLDIFNTETGFIIVDGLNPSNFQQQNLSISLMKETKYHFKLEESKFIIFDASLRGSELEHKNVGLYSVFCDEKSYGIINTQNGFYKITKLTISSNDAEIRHAIQFDLADKS